MKKRDLRKAYGPTPTSFHNTVVRTLNSLEEYDTSSVKQAHDLQMLRKPAKRSPLRVAVICSMILAIGIAGAVTAKAIYPMFAQKEGNYGLNIELEPITGSDTSEQKLNMNMNGVTKTAPEYVRMNIGYLPEGVTGDGMKYSLNEEHNEKCFTFLPDRIVEKTNITDVNIKDYEEFEINGNKAILANVAVEPFSKRFYIYFENEAAFVKAYVTGDVSDEEVKKVMENITFEECTEEDSNVASLTQTRQFLKEEKQNEFWEKFYEAFEKEVVYEYSVVEKGQTLYYGDDHEGSGIELSINNIEILDSIAGLNYDCFEDMVKDDIDEYTDENGTFIPRTREYYIDGDGINAPFKEVSRTDTVTPKLIYATLTVNNPTDETKTFCFQGFDISTLENSEPSPNNLGCTNEFTDPINYIDVNYIDNNNVEKDGYSHGYNYLDVPAGSTQTVHIGFLADEDQLGEMHITIDESWCNQSVFNADTSTFVSGNDMYYHNLAAIKVK